jgi:hypothetical protein
MRPSLDVPADGSGGKQLALLGWRAMGRIDHRVFTLDHVDHQRASPLDGA